MENTKGVIFRVIKHNADIECLELINETEKYVSFMEYGMKNRALKDSYYCFFTDSLESAKEKLIKIQKERIFDLQKRIDHEKEKLEILTRKLEKI